MTDDELSKLEALAITATRGPWEQWGRTALRLISEIRRLRDGLTVQKNASEICAAHDQDVADSYRRLAKTMVPLLRTDAELPEEVREFARWAAEASEERKMVTDKNCIHNASSESSLVRDTR